jgi:hypothetical protein
MAQPPPAPPPIKTAWELFEQLGAELQLAILELIGTAGAESLRRACRAARALVNSRVERICLGVDDLSRAPLSLHARFPRLQRLELETDADGALSSDAFAEFAMAELQSLSSLIELDLRGCKALGTAAAMALERCCPQLQDLDLKDTGALSALNRLGCAGKLAWGVSAAHTALLCRRRGEPRRAAGTGLPHPPDVA